MIVYFADRYMNILGQASTKLPQGLTITEDLKVDDVETGVSSFECVIPFDDSTRAELEKCCKVGNYILRSHNNETEFYTIIESEKDTGEQEVEIYAEDAGLDLLNEVVGKYEADKAYDLAYYVNKYIADSGFVIGINEAKGLTRKLLWEGESTVTERIASIATQFGGFEVSYTFDIIGLAVTKMYVNIFKKRGKDSGAELRLNKQVDRIITTESIYNVATALQCEGGTPEEEENPITLQGYKYDDGDFYISGNRLCSREALKKWNRFKGKDGHIVRQYSYDTTSQATLCAHAITELKKLREVEVNYEIEIKELPDDVQVGDRVNVVDEKGELFLSTRLLQLKTSVCDQKHEAVLGEYLIKDDGISTKVEQLAAEFAAQAATLTDTEKADAIIAKAANALVAAKKGFVNVLANAAATEEEKQAAQAEVETAQAAVNDAMVNATQAAVQAAQATIDTADAQTVADEAYGATSGVVERVGIAETATKQLTDSIASLIVDSNGTSLMTPTEDGKGWTFSTAAIQQSVDDTSDKLAELTGEVGDIDSAVAALDLAVKDLGELAEYVKVGTYTYTDDEGNEQTEPSIDLGESDTGFKLKITNTRICFTDGANTLVYIDSKNKSLNTEKVVAEEVGIGGFVWKKRANGNLGLVWKGAVE